MSNITLTRSLLSAIARVDTAGLSHMQRIDAIAKAIGFETGASLSATLKAAETAKPASAAAPDPEEKPHQAVVIWDPKEASDYLLGEIIEDENRFKWSIESFASPEELTAYLKGVDDGCGWDQPYIAETTTSPHAPFIAARKDDPNLTLAAWHNERMTEDLEDLDEGGDFTPN